MTVCLLKGEIRTEIHTEEEHGLNSSSQPEGTNLLTLRFPWNCERADLCCPLLLLPSIFPSIRIFSNESVLHSRRPKYWSFSFTISPSNEYSGLISFRMDWLDLHAVQGLYSNTKLLLVAQSCPALGDPMDCSMSGFPVFHHLPELAQTHVH